MEKLYFVIWQDSPKDSKNLASMKLYHRAYSDEINTCVFIAILNAVTVESKPMGE